MTEHAAGLKHGLTNYGDRDFSLYLRRSFARSMGYSREMLERPVVGIANTASGFNNCHRHFPELLDAVKRGVLAAGATADRVPDGVARRGVPQSDQPEIPQPDVDRHRGDDPRAADGRGRADGRLRQDGAGAAHGRGFGGAAGGHAGGRADDDRTPQGRAARRLHRLPPLLGALPRRRSERRRDCRGRGQARGDGRHLRGDGHRLDHGLHRRSARPDPARHRRYSGRACRPPARGRGDRHRGGQPHRLAGDARQDRQREVGRECAARAARTRRLDQCDHPSHRHRRTRRRQGDARPAQPAVRHDAGAGQSQAGRQRLHGGLLRRRRHGRAAARAQAAAASRLPDRHRRDARRAPRSRRAAAMSTAPSSRRATSRSSRRAGLSRCSATSRPRVRSSSARPPTQSCSSTRAWRWCSRRSRISRRASTIPRSTCGRRTSWCCRTPARMRPRRCRRPAICRSRRSSRRTASRTWSASPTRA